MYYLTLKELSSFLPPPSRGRVGVGMNFLAAAISCPPAPNPLPPGEGEFMNLEFASYFGEDITLF
jgi:hypothetical protein